MKISTEAENHVRDQELIVSLTPENELCYIELMR